MKQSASEKLKGLGLDVEFLAWLEGEEPRLPDLDQVRKVKDADFAAAIRAAEWLGQFSGAGGPNSLQGPDAWMARYELLQQFLYAALGSSLFYHALSAGEDLEALERVLETLLPRSFWEEYRQDILDLRKQGNPLDLRDVKAKPSGGIKQSEQTDRMRAAVEYISRRSQTPYGDLARFWNERLGKETYRPEELRDRLRQGKAWNKGKGAADRSVKFWQLIYQGDLRAVFPGPFPLPPELKDLKGPKGRLVPPAAGSRVPPLLRPPRQPSGNRFSGGSARPRWSEPY